MRKKYLFLVFVLLVLTILFFRSDAYVGRLKNFLAGIFFIDSITENSLKNDYLVAKNGGQKLKILIVPGHDNESWGTEFRGIKEADLNLELAENLANFLRQEKEFEVILARDKNGYNLALLNYFSRNEGEIKKFIQENVELTNYYIDWGVVEKYTKGVVHNAASEEIVLKLYGINKWANENKIDIAIHVHFNDDPQRSYYGIGKYTGFAIYVPEKQFSNAKGSMALAKPLFNQLRKYFPISDLPKEKSGIVEDQKLIATGSYNTLDAAGLLIEYGYIYEPQFTNPEIRPLAMEELAFQTYAGIKNFFEGGQNRSSVLLPHFWEESLSKGMKNNKEVFILQAALVLEDLYPPENFRKNDCPISGNFGECTLAALQEFQKKYGIEPASGFFGPLTRKKLNEIYSL
jgi:N-acetylmuramoyl-L-alanine amidase